MAAGGWVAHDSDGIRGWEEQWQEGGEQLFRLTPRSDSSDSKDGDGGLGSGSRGGVGGEDN